MKKFLEDNVTDPQNVSIIDGTKEFEAIAEVWSNDRKGIYLGKETEEGSFHFGENCKEGN